MENKKLKTFSMILIISISAILLLAMGSVTSLQDYSKYGINFSDNWNMKSDENEIETYNLGDKIDKKAGFACTISKELPLDFENGDSLFFSTQSIAFKVYVNDEMIYEYGYDTGKIDCSPGDFTHFVRLPNGSEGKLVKIDITFL